MQFIKIEIKTNPFQFYISFQFVLYREEMHPKNLQKLQNVLKHTHTHTFRQRQFAVILIYTLNIFAIIFIIHKYIWMDIFCQLVQIFLQHTTDLYFGDRPHGTYSKSHNYVVKICAFEKNHVMIPDVRPYFEITFRKSH